MPDTPEIPLQRVTLTLCVLCLAGMGGECHSPGCALWLNRAPDIPIRPMTPEGQCALGKSCTKGAVPHERDNGCNIRTELLEGASDG